MEFWGVEVKDWEPFLVTPIPGRLVHISQAALGETLGETTAKDKDVSIPLHLEIDGKDFNIGSLKPEERTQITFDLVFEKKIVLKHDWKKGSVYFAGYLAANPVSDSTAAAPANGASKAAAPANGASKAAKGASAEEEELPKVKVQQSKKRPAESAAPLNAKKAKSVTPEKTGNKKGQNAPPSKAPAGKNVAGNKSKQSPKSGGSGGAGHSGKKGKRGNK